MVAVDIGIRVYRGHSWKWGKQRENITMIDVFSYLVYHIGVGLEERHYIHHIVVEGAGDGYDERESGIRGGENLLGSSHKAVEEGEVVGNIDLAEAVDRSFEVCRDVSFDNKVGGAANPTESSMAGVGTAAVVLHILHGIQILGSLTSLFDEVVVKKKKGAADSCCLLPARRRGACPNSKVETRCEAGNNLSNSGPKTTLEDRGAKGNLYRWR